MGDLARLIEAVEAGTATACDFGLMFPLATNFEHTRAWEAYLGSLDAAKALHDALLPGWDWSVCNVAPDKGAADIGNGTGKLITAIADTPARAWLLAILRALKAKGDPQ